MKFIASLIIVALSSRLCAADPIAQAGPDRNIAWPELHVDLNGSVQNGTAHWYQVSGPAVARFRTDVAAATTAALPVPGTYVFRIVATQGALSASDDVVVVLSDAKPLTAAATAVDHVKAHPKPWRKSGARMHPINRHDYGIPAALAVPLATRYGYNWLIDVTPWTDELMNTPGNKDYEYAQAWKTNPTAYTVTALYSHVMPTDYASKPAGWPDAAFLRNASGSLIDFDTGTGVQFKLSPLAPDSIFINAGTELGQRFKKALGSRGITISAVADQGEWGLGYIGFQWDTATNQPLYLLDPAVKAAAAASPVAKGSIERFLSMNISRQNRLVKEALYAAAGISSTIPWYGYSSCGFNPDRGRSGYWHYWGTYLEDAIGWTGFSSEEYYLNGATWDQTDAGGTPMDFITRLVNTASGQKKISGRSRMVPWISAGGWEPLKTDPTNPKHYLTDRAHYTGFMKMMFTCGAISVFQDDYGNDDRIKYGQAIGTEPTTQVWGLMDAAHVYALFSHVDAYIFDGELVSDATMHPYMGDIAAPRPLSAFKAKGDSGVWVVARKQDSAAKWLVTAFAISGSDRDVQVDIPGMGVVSIRARATGSVYLFDKASSGALSKTWIDETDSMQPTRLWFSDGRGVAAIAPPVVGPGDTTPPATPTAPTVTGDGTARPTLSGTTEPGATVTIRLDGAIIGTVIANGSGTWSWTPSSDLPSGNHQITITATDAGGNVSGESPQTAITVPSSGGGSGASAGGGGSSGGSCGLGSGAAVFAGLLGFLGLSFLRSLAGLNRSPKAPSEKTRKTT